MSRHRNTQPMHTDDVVAPGVRRFRTAWIWVVGIVLILAGVIVVALVLDERSTAAQRDAALSSDEVTELRDFLGQRGVQRDAERAEVQAQLDQQRAVLCQAIATLSASARDRARAVLDQAATDLACDLLPATTPGSSSTSAPPAPGTGPGSAGAATSSGSTAGASSTAGPGAPSPVPGPAVPTRPPTPSPSTPAAPPAPEPDPGPLDPITRPVCGLLGLFCPGGA